MSRPEGIPQDVWAAARKLGFLRGREIIARAILAERERRDAEFAPLVERIERLLANENLTFAECSLAEEWALSMRDALSAIRKGSA
jgi:hypothetical protein